MGKPIPIPEHREMCPYKVVNGDLINIVAWMWDEELEHWMYRCTVNHLKYEVVIPEKYIEKATFKSGEVG